MLKLDPAWPPDAGTYDTTMHLVWADGHAIGWMFRTEEGLYRWRFNYCSGGIPHSDKDDFINGSSDPLPQAEALAAMYAVYRLTAKA